MAEETAAQQDRRSPLERIAERLESHLGGFLEQHARARVKFSEIAARSPQEAIARHAERAVSTEHGAAFATRVLRVRDEILAESTDLGEHPEAEALMRATKRFCNYETRSLIVGSFEGGAGPFGAALQTTRREAAQDIASDFGLTSLVEDFDNQARREAQAAEAATDVNVATLGGVLYAAQQELGTAERRLKGVRVGSKGAANQRETLGHAVSGARGKIEGIVSYAGSIGVRDKVEAEAERLGTRTRKA